LPINLFEKRLKMGMLPDQISDIFKGLETGDGAAFFHHVAEDVDWTVMGTHPLAGHYAGKQAFISGTFVKLARVLEWSERLSRAMNIASSCTIGCRSGP
jgi:uncharacterized protein